MAEGRETTPDAYATHDVGLRKNLGRWTVACHSCPWTEFHYDESTAYREAARHTQAMRGRSAR